MRLSPLKSVIHLVAAALLLATGAAALAAGDPLPLRDTRKIRFTTDSGTWMSLDISPDGRRIVFDMLGEIYELGTRGGNARPLITGLAFDSQPVFSPDGRHIAFVSDRSGNENLWVADADGKNPRQLSRLDDNTEFTSPAWSPDGRFVYVSRVRPDRGHFEVWAYDIAGGSGLPVFQKNGRHALGVVASPDGRHIYYASKSGRFGSSDALPLWSIHRLNLENGDEETVITAQGSAMRPALSPDGQRLLYATRLKDATALRIRDLETGDDRLVAYPVQLDEQESWSTLDLLPRHAFTPDGAAVIFSHEGRIKRLELASGKITVVPLSADLVLDAGPSLRREIAEDEGPVRARLIRNPTQSPDGRKLVFSAFARLYVMDLDKKGAAARRLTTGDLPEFQPAWSPDGKHVTFVTWTARDGGHIWRVKRDGGTPERLTRDPAYYSDPAFTPDGRAVMALRSSHHDRLHTRMEYGAFRQADLVRLDAGTGKLQRIASGSFGGPPQFTRDADRVYVHAAEGLTSFRLDGSDRRRHVKVTGPAYYFQEGRVPVFDLRISPDGQWLLAQIRSQLYLVAMPPVGGDMLEIDVGTAPVAHRKLTTVGADFMDWADGGRTITWAVGASFYRRPLGSVDLDGPPETNDSIARNSQEIVAVVEMPRDKPEGTLVLRGATAITMKGDEVIADADILIRDNRIAAVGPRGSLDIPENAEIRDLSGRFIMPGLVDTHAHWAEIRRRVLDLENYGFLANLAFGVTAGLDVSTLTIDMLPYEDMLAAGMMTGLRAYSTGPAVFSFNEFQSEEQVRDVLTRYKDHYRVQNLKQYRVGNRRVRQWFANVARELELMPTTEGASNLKLDLTQVIDGYAGLEHVMPAPGFADDVVNLFRKTNVGYSPTLIISDGVAGIHRFTMADDVANDPKIRRFFPRYFIDEKSQRLTLFRDDRYAYPHYAQDVARIFRAGGIVGAGSHSEFEGIALHWEMEMLATALSPHEVLRIATMGSSAMIGRAGQLGSIEPGKFADLLVLTRNPLEDVRHARSIQFVMKNGRLYDGETLDEVWPRQKPQPRLWFWDEDGVKN